ncbi:MAG TPA: sugar-binding transcriptional regulator [Rubrobacteraceae bacterium]|nr:sugar-binding transcriptional regulator [Rubrobacteraceae bacterium]
MLKRYPVDYRSLTDEDHLILKVIRLYYEHDLTQAQVASRMGFSRPKVSKLLSEARERGLVKIEVAEPAGDSTSLEIALEDRYGLEESLVVPTSEDREATELSAGRAGATLLARACGRDTVLGLSWGVSLRALADAAVPRAFSCKKVVPLVGGMGNAKIRLHSNQVCAALAEKLGVESLDLAAPAIASSPESRADLAALPGIQETLAEGERCDVAVVGIGGILPSSTLVEAGYFTLEEFLGLRERGVVGDVCCHFLDLDGAPRLPGFSGRIVGITLEQLRSIPHTIGIATGAEKGPGAAAVLKGGYVKSLVCDEDLAHSLVEISNEGELDERI